MSSATLLIFAMTMLNGIITSRGLLTSTDSNTNVASFSPSAKAGSSATAEDLSEQQLTIVSTANDLSVSNITSDLTASPHTDVKGYLSLLDNKKKTPAGRRVQTKVPYEYSPSFESINDSTEQQTVGDVSAYNSQVMTSSTFDETDPTEETRAGRHYTG